MRRAATRGGAAPAVAALAAAVAFAALAAAGPAIAQSSEEAKESFANGVALYNEGDYQGALAEFLSAYEAKPHHSVLYNIAQCYQMIDANQKAIAYYEQYLDEGADYIKEKKKAQVLEEIGKIKALLTPVTVKVAPDGADVSVDGKGVGTAPIEEVLYLDPGEHVILVEKQGFAPHKQEFVAKRGDAIAFEIDLAAEVLTGVISVKSTVEGATATVDGEDVGELPAEKILPAGEHEVVVSAPGHADVKKTVVVDKGGKIEVAIDPKPLPAVAPAPQPAPEPAPIAEPVMSKKHKALKDGAVSMGVIGAVAIVMGGLTGYGASMEKEHFLSLREDILAGENGLQGRYEDRRDTGRKLNAAFLGLLGGGAACLAIMLALAPLAAKEAKKGSKGVEVVPAAGGAAVIVTF